MYSSKAKHIFVKFIRGSEMTRIKSRVVAVAAHAALLVFMFAGGAGAANCPPDDEINFRWSSTPQAYVEQEGSITLSVKIDGHSGGSYSWYVSGPGTITPFSNGNQAEFTASSNAAGQVIIQCTYSFVNEQTGESCSYYVHHILYVYGVDMYFAQGGVLCKYGWYSVGLTTLPSTSGGKAQFEYDPTEVSVYDSQGQYITSGSSRSVPNYISVQPLEVSASWGDVELTYNYILGGNVLHSDTVHLTVVDMYDVAVSRSVLELGETQCRIGYEIDAPAAMTFTVYYDVRDRNNMLQYSSSQNKTSGSWSTEYWNGKNTNSGKYADLTGNDYTANIALFYGGRSIIDYSFPISVEIDDIKTTEKSFSQEVSSTIIDDDVEISIELEGAWEVTDLDLSCLPLSTQLEIEIIGDDYYDCASYPFSISEDGLMADVSIPSFTVPVSMLNDGVTVEIYLNVYGTRSLLKEFTLADVDLEIELRDEEPDTDPRAAVRDASGLDMSTLAVTLNGNAVATSIMTITDISSGSLVVGKKLQFTAPCSMLNLSGSNEVKVNVSDNAGNAMDEVTQSFVLP